MIARDKARRFLLAHATLIKMRLYNIFQYVLLIAQVSHGAVITLSLTSPLSIATDTATTPSQPGLNQSLSCNFTTFEDAVNLAEDGKVNATRLVETCPHVCALVYGVGNPDLSGIGVSSQPVREKTPDARK